MPRPHSPCPPHTASMRCSRGQGTTAKVISSPWPRANDPLELITEPLHILIPLILYRKQGHFLAVNNVYRHYLRFIQALQTSLIFFLIFLESSTYLVNGGKLLASLMCGRIILFTITLTRLLLRGSHLLPYSPAPPIGPPLNAKGTTTTFKKLITRNLTLQDSQKLKDTLNTNH